MAFSIKQIFFFFFLYVFALFFTQINARDSFSFDKFHRQNPNNVDQEIDQNPSFIPDSEKGYGLYGHENEDSFSNNPSLSQTQESYESYPKTTESRYNNVEREGMSDTRFMDNGKYYFDVNDERNHGSFYRKHQSNYKYKYNPTTGYNYENEKSFKNPYNSPSENNNNQQSHMFGEEQRDEFTP